MRSETARCGRCGREIVWAETVTKAGGRMKMAFDHEPVERGGYCVMRRAADGALYALYVPRGKEFPPGGLPRSAHYKTCPSKAASKRI